MMSKIIIYRTYLDKQDAQNIIEILKQNKIPYTLEENSLNIDSTFGGSDYNSKSYALKIYKNDLEKVEQIETELLKNHVENVGKDYYLYKYSDEELVEIVMKKDEWDTFDYLVAQKILKERGKEVSPELIKVINKQRVKEFLTPEKPNYKIIIAGYFFALLGGLIGFAIGIFLINYKKTLPNGETIYGFSEDNRLHGKYILALSSVCFIVWLRIKYSLS